VVHGYEPDRGISHRLQLDVLRNIAGADELDAVGPHAERAIGLDHRQGMIAGRKEYKEHVRLLVFDALEKWRHIGYRPGAAHRDLVDHLATVALEGAFEGVETVLTGRE